MNSTIYLSIDQKNGKLHEVSSHEQDGFYPVKKSNGSVYYRRDIKMLIGRLTSISERKNTHLEGNPKEVWLTITSNTKDGEINFVVKFFRDDQRGDFNTYMQDFVKQIPALDKNTVYKFSPYNFKPEGKDKNVRGFSFKNNETGEAVAKLTVTYTDKETGKTVKGDLPERSFEFKRDKWIIKQDEYLNALFDIWSKALEDFKFEGGSGPQYEGAVYGNTTPSEIGIEEGDENKSVQGTVKSVKAQPVAEDAIVEEDDDDLPF